MPGSGSQYNPFRSGDEFEELWQEQRKRDREAQREAQKALEELKQAQELGLKALNDELSKQGLDLNALKNLKKMLEESQRDVPAPAVEAPCLITIGNNQRAIRAIGVASGKPFIALITGRGGQFKWERKWVGQRTSRSRTVAEGEIELVAGFGSLGTLPAALDIRWGPADGKGGLCVCRGFFRALAAPPYFEAISEQQVAFIINQRVTDVPDRPVRSGRRAPIDLDEEV